MRFGQTLPRAFFASSYLIADYGCLRLRCRQRNEWVLDDTDALLVNTDSGEILQVEYDVFG
jgi:Ni/Co efflux regulator RcnB